MTPKFLGINHLTTAHRAENSISQETGRKKSGNETGRSSVTEVDTKRLLSKNNIVLERLTLTTLRTLNTV